MSSERGRDPDPEAENPRTGKRNRTRNMTRQMAQRG